jgi:hypothetical protein
MIQNWGKFNESKGMFTHDMAQEIVYYFSEDSTPSREIAEQFDELLDSEEASDHFIAYEAGHEDYKKMIQKLLGLANTASLSFRDGMIDLYNKIRTKRESFPEICEIEDAFLDWIEEYRFNFVIYTKDSYYTIKFYKEDCSLVNFIQYCERIEVEMKRLNSEKTIPILEECSRHEFGQNDSSCSFKIILKKKF